MQHPGKQGERNVQSPWFWVRSHPKSSVLESGVGRFGQVDFRTLDFPAS